MEIRWLGEVEPTFNPSFYPSLVRISMARRFHHDIAQSGWATVKLGIDPGEVFSKGPAGKTVESTEEDIGEIYGNPVAR